MMMAQRKISILQPLSGYRIAVGWEDHEKMEVDLTYFINHFQVFSPLRDPALFMQARIGEHRRVVEWPVPADDSGEPILDIDAETLLEIALEQQSRRVKR